MTASLQPRLALDTPARREAIRMIEAILFAAAEPLDAEALQVRLPPGLDVRDLLETLVEEYRPRGVNLVMAGGKWMFRTAEDLSWLLAREATETRRLPRAALETLATIAYHQPVTRAEIEQVRGVHISKGTIDVLLEAGWIRLRGRRRTPGRPLTYGTTEAFLVHFGLETIQDLPGLDDLKGAGLLEGQVPAGFSIPTPSDARDLAADEDPLDAADAPEAEAPDAPAGEDEP